MIKVGIVGGAGYAGGELIRLLLCHKHVEISFVHSKSNAGKPLFAVHQDLVGETALLFCNSISQQIDVLFMCLGHGEANQFLAEHSISPNIKIIDLSQDFRLSATANHPSRQFVYGLPELNKSAITTANAIANPGCFATAIQLSLLPLAKAKLLDDIFVTGITGSTGAGQSLSATSHFSWRSGNIQAYKTLNHQHLFEVHESLHQLMPDFPSSPEERLAVHFVPWRGDFTRGIFTSAQLKCALPLNEVVELYNNYYKEHPFVFVAQEPIFLKQVINTNKCLLQIEKQADGLVVHAIIDNLIKGASGQALQNMNLMFGLDEKEGLHLKSSYF